MQRAAQAVAIPEEIVQVIQRIWVQHRELFKEDRREGLSDRRLKKVIELLRVSAATNGRDTVDLSDVFLLKDCLWNHPDNALKVRELITGVLRSFSRPVPLDGSDKSAHTAKTKTIPTAPAKSSSTSGRVVKGLQGLGTAQDPLLIKTMDNLMDLAHPEVGPQGYYFRQTGDIDCTALGFWSNIAFQGHYDGGGHTIRFNSPPGGVCFFLFMHIKAQSSVKKLKLKNIHLAGRADNSLIVGCESNTTLIANDARNCTITDCQAGNHLVGGSATGCTITGCQAGNGLIVSSATNYTITDSQQGDDSMADLLTQQLCANIWL